MTSPFLDRPLSLALALPRLPATIETELAIAGPIEKLRLH
jgi:hypothetical protein